MTAHPDNTAPHRGPSHARPLLWVCAGALGALLVVQASRLGDGEARAEMVSMTPGGQYTALTTDSGTGEMLMLMDSRSEAVSVYKVVNQSSVELFKRYDLTRLFSEARARATGRK